jgi:hypothetical protein
MMQLIATISQFIQMFESPLQLNAPTVVSIAS